MVHGRRPLLFLAAPYTHPDPVRNTHKVIHVAESVYALTDWVPIVPHLTMLWHTVIPHDIGYWYDYDVHLLNACDAFVRLPGDSVGADHEVKEAQRLRLDELFFADLPEATRRCWE